MTQNQDLLYLNIDNSKTINESARAAQPPLHRGPVLSEEIEVFPSLSQNCTTQITLGEHDIWRLADWSFAEW